MRHIALAVVLLLAFMVVAPMAHPQGANFSRLRALGDSLTICTQGGIMSDHRTQVKSWVVLVAAQINTPLRLPLLTEMNLIGQQRRMDYPNYGTIDVYAYNGVSVDDTFQKIAQEIPWYQFGWNHNHLELILAGKAGHSLLSALVADNPTFVVGFLGSNDFMNRVMARGTIMEGIPTLGLMEEIDPLDGRNMRPQHLFYSDFKTVVSTIAATGAKMCFGTLPILPDIPGILNKQELTEFIGPNPMPPDCHTNYTVAAAVYGGLKDASIFADDRNYYTPAELQTINDAITGYNNTIRSLAADPAHPFAVAETPIQMPEITNGTLRVNGWRINNRIFVNNLGKPRASIMSTDGVHMSDIGNALCAQAYIRAINSYYGTNIPELTEAQLTAILNGDPFVDNDGDGRIEGLTCTVAFLSLNFVYGDRATGDSNEVPRNAKVLTSYAAPAVCGRVIPSLEGPEYFEGQSLTLTAVVDSPDCEFLRWDGDVPAHLKTQNPLNVVMNTHKTIIGVFVPPIVVSQQPTGVSIICGQDFELSVSASIALGGLTYQWQRYGGDIPGANGPTLSVTGAHFSDAGGYRCIITSDTFPNKYIVTNEVDVQVHVPTVTVTEHPVGKMLFFGEELLLEANGVTNSGGITYQWLKDGEEITDATDAVLHIPAVGFGDAGSYCCIISSALVPAAKIASNTVPVMVFTPPIVVTHQPTGAILPEGSTHTLRTEASISWGGLTYQWQFNGIDLAGAGGTDLTVTNVNAATAGHYRCRISSDSFTNHSLYTANVYLGVGRSTVVFVDKHSPAIPGSENGQSWQTAYKTIQQGINAAYAAGGGQVWVAGGPRPGGYVYDELRTEAWGNPPVTGSLILKEKVEVYGGFEGWYGRQETSLEQRGVRLAITIIDASQSRGGMAAYHAVVVGNENGPIGGTRLDGFDVRGGSAIGNGLPSGYHTYRGGGLYCWLSSPVIANCTFYHNTAAVSGGAVAVEGKATFGICPAPTIVNCVFFSNHAARNEDATVPPNPIRGGGAIFCNLSAPMIHHCTLTQNSLGTPEYTSWGALGGGIYAMTASPVVRSSIIWGNTTGGIQSDYILGEVDRKAVAWSNVQVPSSVVSGPGNISLNPVFLFPEGPEFHLDPDLSPCLNAADPSAPFPSRDLPGVPRPQEGTPDMGAYEHVALAASVMCRNTEGYLNELGEAIVTPQQMMDPSTVSPAGIWRLQLAIGSGLQNFVTFNCNDMGVIPADLILTDFLGRTATCSGFISVTDLVPPAIACRDIVVNLNDEGLAMISAADINNGTVDNCDAAPLLELNRSTFTCDDLGETHITLLAADQNANQAFCTVSVNVRDTTPARITWDGISYVEVPYQGVYVEEGAIAEDACDGQNPAIVGGDTVDTSVPGIYVITYEYTDSSGNVSVPLERIVRVLDPPLHFTKHPADTEAYQDDPPFDLTAIFGGGINPQTYQWFRVREGETTPLGLQPISTPPPIQILSLPIDPAALAVGQYEYYVEVTDDFGTIRSNNAVVTIAYHMHISGDIGAAEVLTGTTYSMAVTIEGGLGPLHYQWYKESNTKTMQPLSDVGSISGTATSTLTFDPFTLADAGNYQVSISDNRETIWSSVATLTALGGIPVAGLAGIILLAAVSAVGGVLALYRRQQ